MSLDDTQQYARTPLRPSAPLLPISEGARTDAHERRELGLAKAVTLSQGTDIGFVKSKRPRRPPLASEDGAPLANALKKFREQVVLHGYSASTSRRRARLCSTVRSSASFLAKGEQHQKLAARRMPEVDDPCSAALPPPAQRPAELPQTTRATNDLAGIRSSDESELQESVLLGRKQIVDPADENPRLDDDHGQSIRQWRMSSKAFLLCGWRRRLTATRVSGARLLSHDGVEPVDRASAPRAC